MSVKIKNGEVVLGDASLGDQNYRDMAKAMTMVQKAYRMMKSMKIENKSQAPLVKKLAQELERTESKMDRMAENLFTQKDIDE